MNKKIEKQARDIINTYRAEQEANEQRARQAKAELAAAESAAEAATLDDNLDQFMEAQDKIRFNERILEITDRQRAAGISEEIAGSCQQLANAIRDDLREIEAHAERRAARILKELHEVVAGVEKEIDAGNAIIGDLEGVASAHLGEKYKKDGEMFVCATEHERRKHQLAAYERGRVLYEHVPNFTIR